MEVGERVNRDAPAKAWYEKASRVKTRDARFDTLGGLPLELLYHPDETDGEYGEKQGFPGEFP